MLRQLVIAFVVIGAVIGWSVVAWVLWHLPRWYRDDNEHQRVEQRSHLELALLDYPVGVGFPIPVRATPQVVYGELADVDDIDPDLVQ